MLLKKTDNILLVEDNPGFARLLQEMLLLDTDNNFNIVHVTSLASALQQLDNKIFDIILSDLKLTDSEGLETIRAILNKELETPVVVLTGLDDVETSAQAIREGAQDYLIKGNFNARQLVRSLHYAQLRSGLHNSIKHILEKTVDIIVVYDQKHKLLYLNQQGRLVLGDTAEQRIAEHFTDISAIEDGVEKVIECGDGKKHTFEVRVTAIKWKDQEDVILVFLHDISWQKEAQRVLLKSNDELEAQVEARARDLVRSNRALQIIGAFNQKLIHPQSEQSLLQDLCNILVEVATYDLVWASRLKISGDKPVELERVAQQSSKGSLDDSLQKDLWSNSNIVERICSNAMGGGISVIQDIEQAVSGEVQDSCVEQEAGSLIVAPIVTDDDAYGVVSIYSKCRQELDDSEKELLVKLIENLSFGIRTIRNLEATRKLSMAIEQTPDPIMITDKDGIIEYVNSAFEKITGYSKAEVLGNTPNLVKSGFHDQQFFNTMWGAINQGDVFRDVFINRRKDGLLYYEEKTIAAIKDSEGNIVNYISAGKDVTDRLKAEERLQYLANYDVVTDLPNQSLLLDRINQSIQRVSWHNRSLAVLSITLTQYTTVRDSLGQETADELVCKVAGRLSDCVRTRDTVSRLGNDVLAVLLDDMAKIADASIVVNKIIETFSEHIVVHGSEYYVTMGIGVSCYPQDGLNAQLLLQNAQIAMQKALEKGINCYQFFASELNTHTLHKLNLTTELNHAVNRQEFEPYYHPLIEIETGNVVGVEVLLRWNHPKRDVVLPLEFISTLEETNLIVPVGRWVLDKACYQHTEWRKMGLPNIVMAVNLSVVQFKHDDISAIVKQVLDKHDMEPRQLELEITESIFMNKEEVTLEALRKLREMGVRLSIDDFGTGYSSLEYLSRFPANNLKIDKGFVQELPDSKNNAEIVSAIIAVAHSMNVTVTAEGVETDEQLNYLKQQQCDVAQGYLYSKPLPSREMTMFLMNHFHDSQLLSKSG